MKCGCHAQSTFCNVCCANTSFDAGCKFFFSLSLPFPLSRSLSNVCSAVVSKPPTKHQHCTHQRKWLPRLAELNINHSATHRLAISVSSLRRSKRVGIKVWVCGVGGGGSHFWIPAYWAGDASTGVRFDRKCISFDSPGILEPLGFFSFFLSLGRLRLNASWGLGFVLFFCEALMWHGDWSNEGNQRLWLVREEREREKNNWIPVQQRGVMAARSL